MDKRINLLVVIASIVVVLAGSRYLWVSYMADIEERCRNDDVIVRAALESGSSSLYRQYLRDCIDRGGPI
jgi:hypothetical protein